MPIDWKNLPTLIGPRRKMVLAERDSRDRLARSHMRRAKGPKNHATNKERSQVARAKAKRIAKATAEREARITAFRKAVREYWAGERENYPAVL